LIVSTDLKSGSRSTVSAARAHTYNQPRRQSTECSAAETMQTRWLDETVEVLSVAETYQADAAAAAAGVRTLDLMEAAGAAVAERVAATAPEGSVAILCGPGNNGGDGFVAARLLAAAGRDVRLSLLGDPLELQGDAAENARRWQGNVELLSPASLDGAAVVVDAIFGAGLARPLDGAAAATVAAIDKIGVPCISVDVPSGIDGDTGAVLGTAPRARETVTFFRRKPAHLLYPGRGLCGAVHVADIGVPASVLDRIAPRTSFNNPASWRNAYPWPRPEGHKYSRGHVVVAGGAVMTGAARLASHAALRVGAGLVTVFCAPEAGAIYRSGPAGIIVRDIPDVAAFAEALRDSRITTVVLGPGLGIGESARALVLAALGAGKRCVLDADALTTFANDQVALCDGIARAGDCILTPHEGEFARLFAAGTTSKLERARAAARRAGAVIVLKGADTVIASPDGRLAINANAPPDLATAGAGDALAGFVAGLLAQGMPAYEAACAGVWLHGAAAAAFGPGLIATDLADALPAVLRQLRDSTR
jgi:NAD(P)H-hydrate epimerase